MSKISQWFFDANAVALPQSIIPTLVAISLALSSENFSIEYAILALIGVIATHLAVNLLDDYFDFQYDEKNIREKLSEQGLMARRGKCAYLVEGRVTLKELRFRIAILTFIAIAIGIFITFARGWQIILIGCITAFLGFFYTAQPLKLASRGGKEIITGLIFGPLLLGGVYFSACGSFSSTLWITAIIMGIAVFNIAYVHAFIDQTTDKITNKITIPIIINNNKWSFYFSVFCISLPYIIVGFACLLQWISIWYMFTWLTIPIAIILIKTLYIFIVNPKQEIKRHFLMGPMQYWELIQQANMEWFMIRWYLARNLLSSLAIIIIFINLALIIFL